MGNKFFLFYYNWWKNIDKIILIIIAILFLLGLFFSLVSTSIIASEKMNTNSYYFFLKHLVFVIISFVLLIFFSALDKEKLLSFCLIMFFISFIFLLMVPLIGVEVKGSKRWIDLSFLPRFQPIEFVKPFTVVILSLLLSFQKIKGIYLKYFFTLIIILPIIFLLVIQPDIGQTFLIVSLWMALIFVSGINLFLFFPLLFILGIFLSYIIIFVPKFIYIKKRIISYLDSSQGDNYQSDKASEAIMNGGFFGKGIGEGTLNSKVPEAHTDYIISVISEEFGVIIVILIMLIYLFLAFKVVKKIDNENDETIKLILLGSITLILLQIITHIGVNISFFPTTGMTLPFLSYGGSSIISTAIFSGIILNLTKRKIQY